MTINQGNVLKVVHTTGCTWRQAEEALRSTNLWPDTYSYARKLME